MNSKTIMTIAICILAVLLIVELILSNITVAKLTNALYIGDFDAYEKVRKSKITLLFVKQFNLLFMDLNKSLMKGDTNQVDEEVKKFEKIKSNYKQKEAVYSKAFYYYLSIENKEKAKEMYELLEIIHADSINNGIGMAYDTFVLEGFEYLDKALYDLKNAPLEEKPGQESMIAKMYENKGDKKMAKEYNQLAIKHIEELQKKACADKK